MRRYTPVILDLLERPAPSASEMGNELTPPALDVREQAMAAWVAFHDRIEAAMAQRHFELEYLRRQPGKAAENALRIVAAVLTASSRAPKKTIIKPRRDGRRLRVMTWYVGYYAFLACTDAAHAPQSSCTNG